MSKPISVIDAPSNLDLRPPGPGREPGVRRRASVLRGRGVVGRLGARDGGVVVPPTYSFAWDGASVRNGAAIREFAVALAGRVGSAVGGGRFPPVLGGDCSIMIDALRALLRSGLVVGMDVTIFDPDGDPRGEIAEGLTSALVEAFEEDA